MSSDSNSSRQDLFVTTVDSNASSQFPSTAMSNTMSSSETGARDQANLGARSTFALGPQHQLHQANRTEQSLDNLPTQTDPWMSGRTTNQSQTDSSEVSHRKTSPCAAAVSPTDPTEGIVLETNDSTHLAIAETTIIKQPSPFDVVLEDNMALPPNPGNPATSTEANASWHNTTFAEMLASYAEAFSLAPLSTQAVIVQAIASRIHHTNGRFLERYGKGWKEISEKNSVFLGIARALFHQVQVSTTNNNASTSQSVLVPQESNNNNASDSTSAAGSMSSSENSSLNDPTSTVLRNPNQNAVLQLYIEPMRSSDTMGRAPFTSVSKVSGASPVSSSRMANVSLPLSCSATLQTSYSQAAAKAKVAKRTKLAKKSSTSSVVVKKASNSHNADGTFAHKRGGSPIIKKGNTSQRKRGTLSPSFKSKNLLTAADTIAGFDPQSWFAEFGTLQSMNDRAIQLVECISVDAIPRGVTVRPSGKWQAQFYFDGQSRYIGVFDGSHQAALAYECVHRLLAGYRELSRSKMSDNNLSKEDTRKLFDNARLASVRAVSSPPREQSFAE